MPEFVQNQVLTAITMSTFKYIVCEDHEARMRGLDIEYPRVFQA